MALVLVALAALMVIVAVVYRRSRRTATPPAAVPTPRLQITPPDKPTPAVSPQLKPRLSLTPESTAKLRLRMALSPKPRPCETCDGNRWVNKVTNTFGPMSNAGGFIGKADDRNRAKYGRQETSRVPCPNCTGSAST